MSKFSNVTDGAGGSIVDIVEPLDYILKDRGDDFVSQDAISALVSSESINDAKLSDIKTEYNGIATDIASIASDSSIELTDAQKEAGAIVAMASRSPLEYHNRATTVATEDFGANINVIDIAPDGVSGKLDYRDEIGIEAFDERELKSHIAYSTAFNVAAAKQDDFGEAFYPTVVVTPDQVGVTMSISNTVVHKEIRRNSSGDVIDWDRRNLIEAAADATILESRATTVIPYFNPDDSNADKFVDKTLISPRVIDLDGVPIRTSALAVGVCMDVLGLSQAPGILNNAIMDSTDSLDSRLGIKQLYLHVSTADGSQSSIISFSTVNLARSLFNKSQEGNNQEMELNFRTDAIMLRGNTTDIAGNNVLKSFKSLSKYQLTLKTIISGSANLETGLIDVNVTKLTVDGIFDVGGSKLSDDDPGVIEALKDLTFEIVGYDLEAYRTNTNLRTRGMMLDTITITEGYKVGLGAPITVPAPVSSSGRSGVDLKSMIAAVRMRTNNNAVTALLNFISRMRTYTHALETGEPSPAIEGIARHVILPVYKEHTLDLLLSVDSDKTSEKDEDIRKAIVSTIRYIVYNMINDSNYQVALDFDTGGGGVKPKLLIGTDPVTAQYIVEYGDDRTASVSFEDFTIVTTNDTRMRDKIVLGFTRAGRNGDALSFGMHAFMPELTSTVQVTRNGATTKENQVQPRDLHINNLPIIGVINVENLDEVVHHKISQKTI